ncbi:hypothetical protein C8R44DRAFT_864441 [Mycena epipterygia]|nr:hypothetical protein C8R44DRAFT_864441 [Mycena epipterygia]
MRVAIFASAILGLLIPTTFAVPVATTVLTPRGYRPNVNMHAVPAGGRIAHVGADIHVINAAGEVVHVATPKQTAATKTAAAVSPEETGWVAYADYLYSGSSPISSFTTTWTVPPVPVTNHGQTIFLFNSIEPSSFDAIMQPVLQFGGSAAGGGSFWAVASWYLYMDQTFFTTPVAVSAGQTLNGIISLVSQSGTAYNYNTQFTNVGGTALTIDGGEELNWITETLESYATTETSDYPTGSTVFSGINVVLVDGTTPAVSWSTSSDPADGLSATINANGGKNARVTITY